MAPSSDPTNLRPIAGAEINEEARQSDNDWRTSNVERPRLVSELILRQDSTAGSNTRAMTGLVSGLLGCMFGTIGIFALALVFVPLAALCTLVGLVRGVVGRSVAGVGTSLLAGVVTLIAVLTSPTLLLLLGGAATATALAGSQATADVRSPPIQPSRSVSSAPVASPQAPARASVQTADIPGSGPPVSMTAAVAEAQAAIIWCRNRRLSARFGTLYQRASRRSRMMAEAA